MTAAGDLGTLDWVERTGGQLTAADRRSLLRPVARTGAAYAAGRLAMLLRINSGRRARVAPAVLVPPDSALTRAAFGQARELLPPWLLRHSYRTFAFGAALGALEGLTVDRELLFAAALLHDTGLVAGADGADFTRRSARVARDVAEDAGLSTATTRMMRTAITLHLNPDVPVTAGPVARLLSAGAAVDVLGVRAWELPPDVVAAVLEQHPRDGFAAEFTAAFRSEAARVPRGRVQFLRRWAAFDLGIRWAPFPG